MKEFLRSWREAFKFVEDSSSSAKLVIYVEGAEYSSYFEPLIDALSAFECLKLFYLTSDSTDPMLSKASKRFIPYYIGNGSARTFVLNRMKAEVLLLTMPDLNTFHIKRSPQCKNYVYFHHSMVSTHMVYRKEAFDHFDTMLCVGPHHIEEVRQWEKIKKLAPKHLLEHGYAPLDSIRKVSPKCCMPERNDDRSLNILFAPSWGPEGLMETRSEEMVSLLLAAGYHVHVRPHPRTRQLNNACLVNIQNKFHQHPNFEMNCDITQFDAFFRSHIMISDWSGAAMEFTFGLERPVLFIDVPRKINNTDYQKIDAIPVEVSYREQVGMVLAPENLREIPKALEALYEGYAIFQESIQECRKNTVFHLDQSAERGARHIYELITIPVKS